MHEGIVASLQSNYPYCCMWRALAGMQEPIDDSSYGPHCLTTIAHLAWRPASGYDRISRSQSRSRVRAMSYLFPRDLSNNPPNIVRGEGSYLIDDGGRRYLDASGGPAVSCLGHNHPKVVAAIQKQVAAVSYAYSL